MSTTSAPTRPDPTRTGAVWVTGTGAFLLLAAAAVFTAVRWDEIPAVAKLAALGLATGACLVSGRTLAGRLPATAGAVFHLGAFLVPLDVAALGVRGGLTWDQMLLAQGATATVVFTWAAAVERSVVLRWAAAGAVVALAGGLSATTAVPPALLLAGLAGAAAVAGREQEALGWASVAGLAPVVALDGALGGLGSGTTARLGLAVGAAPGVALLTAVGAGAVIAAVARRREQPDLALVGAAVAVVSGVASWAGADLAPSHGVVALGVAFLVAQLAAFATRDDAFWSLPATTVATIGEVLASIGVVAVAAAGVGAVVSGDVDVPIALTATLLCAGWVVADRRDTAFGTEAVPTLAGLGAVAAVALASADGSVTALALSTVAGLAVVVRRPGTTSLAVIAGYLAPVLAWGEPVVLGIGGVVGGLVAGEVAVRRSRATDAVGSVDRRRIEDDTWALTLVATGAPLLAVWGIADAIGHLPATLVGGVLACTGLAAWLDRGTTSAALPLGTLARVAAATMLVGWASLDPGEIAVVAAVVALCSLVDALRLGHPGTALGASLGAPLAIGALLRSSGLSTASSGVGLAVAALVLTGLGTSLGRTWVGPTGVAAAIALGAGLALTSTDPVASAHVVLVAAAVVALAGTTVRRSEVLASAGLLACCGAWLELGAAGVTSSEPYLLPVVVVLLVAGERARRLGSASSWIAHGPSIALLGGAALAERISGGAGWHAVVAGTVGVAAVAMGGSRRLGGPLVLGTALLVAVVGYESLAITAGMPTWSWLALGGVTLLGAGVAMERHEVGPLETGRRLVDVVNDKFA